MPPRFYLSHKSHCLRAFSSSANILAWSLAHVLTYLDANDVYDCWILTSQAGFYLEDFYLTQYAVSPLSLTSHVAPLATRLTPHRYIICGMFLFLALVFGPSWGFIKNDDRYLQLRHAVYGFFVTAPSALFGPVNCLNPLPLPPWQHSESFITYTWQFFH
jgi:hypothetical protein